MVRLDGRGAILFCFLASACDGACVEGRGGVPGGFASSDLIDRAAQIRATDRGLETVAALLQDEVRRELVAPCASACPIGFVGPSGPIAASCVNQVCREGGASAPYFALPVPSSTGGGAIVCPSGDCVIDGRFESLAIAPNASGVRVTLGAQLVTSVDAQVAGVDCVATLAAAPADVVLNAQLAPRSSGATQLALDVTSAAVTLAPGALALTAPSGDAQEAATCAAATAAVTTALTSGASDAALAFGRATVGRLLGQVCDVDADCPSGATCHGAHFCAEGTRALLDPLTFDQRIALPSIFASAGYGTSAATEVDTWLGIGGAVDTDAAGVTLGVRAGAEPVTPDARCAAPTPSPRSRPGFVAPAPLAATDLADLDFDGTPETEFDIALGLSRAHLEQLVWSTYQTGLICGRVTERDISDLNTGTLELIIPSLRFLTRGHLFPWSEKPARLSIWLASEPELALGSGRLADVGSPMRPEDNLVVLTLRDLTIELNVLVEERFVRVATITLDVSLGLGASVTPDQELVPVIGSGFADLISNVRVTNSELLTDPPASIASAIPTLVQLGLFEVLGPQDPIALPAVPGLDTEVLGLRSEAVGGTYENVVVYAALTPPATGALREQAETTASIVEVEIPPTADFAGGKALPRVTLALDEAYEHQVRVDGGWWSTFTRGGTRTIAEPAFLLQGTHTIEVRSRVPGEAASLDPSPVKLNVRIDSEPPVLRASIVEGGLSIVARDRISRERVRIFVEDEAGAREVVPDADGFVAWTVRDGALVVRAEDEAGLVSVVELQSAEVDEVAAEAPASCATTGGPSWLVLAGLVVLARRWRRRASAG